MNHAGEIAPLVRMVRPHVGADHDDRAGAYRISRLARSDRRRQGGDLPRPRAGRNGDPQPRRSAVRAARRGGARPRRARADLRRVGGLRRPAGRVRGNRRRARASRPRFSGRSLRFDLGAPGAHMAENALGALLAAEALGADVERSAAALAGFSPQKGRGERLTLAAPGGAITLIDESYNANPASMRAALKLLGAARPGPNGRRDRGHRRHAGTRRGRRGDARGARRRPRGEPGRSPVRGRAADARALRRRAAGRGARRGPSERANSPARSPGRCAPAMWSWSRARTAAGWGRWWPRCATHFAHSVAGG